MKNELIDYCLRLGDSSLILSHRIAEYCSKAPILEEDLAITNVGLDLLGQAENFLTYAAELKGDTTADLLTFKRREGDFRCLHLVQTPNTDFAFILARQFLMDCYHQTLFSKLISSEDETILGISKKAIKEVNYHLDRSNDWIKRLGLGTTESNERLQNAVNDLWMYTDELFIDNSTDIAMNKNKIAPLSSNLKSEWLEMVESALKFSEIKIPQEIRYSLRYGKDGFHTEYLGFILAEMQHLPLLYPDATW
ncbi:MAG: phenylacetate-CoA oxygenase subunit PaaC [Flavobacteriales bacterium]|tara:strand:- start:1802 stop:2554 length:753 start_codon:yes stop_codon:yes gene_type:complete